MRFPSNGDRLTANVGREPWGHARQGAISGILKRNCGAGGLLGPDLFGAGTVVDDEHDIGHRLSGFERFLDFVCMVIYPSQLTRGNIASASGSRSDFPCERIYENLDQVERITLRVNKTLRPWLQDVSCWNLREYDADHVPAQPGAAEECGTNGWMQWGDLFNVTVEALRLDN